MSSSDSFVNIVCCLLSCVATEKKIMSDTGLKAEVILHIYR